MNELELKQQLEQIKTELMKSISAGYGYAGMPASFTTNTALQGEDLDATMRSITLDMKNIKLWNQLQSSPVKSLVHQYNRKIALGPQNNNPYVSETGIADESDSKYVRVVEYIRFFSKTRKYSLISTQVNMMENPEQIQINDGTAELIRDLERELYFGLSQFMNKSTGNISASASDLPRETIEMRGLWSQIVDAEYDVQQYSGDMLGYGEPRSCIKDMEGGQLSQFVIEEAFVNAVENFGLPNVLHAPPKAISHLVTSLYNIARAEPGIAGMDIGYSVSSMVTSAGKIKLESNTFLMPLTTVFPSQNITAPSTAGVTVVAQAVTCPETDPKRGAKLPAGKYKYIVHLVNTEGYVSQPIFVDPVDVAVGEEVRLTISGMPSNIRSVKVSRSAPNGAKAFYVGQYAVIPTVDTVVDRGHLLPQTGSAFLLQLDSSCMAWKSLMPLTKINLARVDHSVKFSLLLAGTLVVYTPRFNSLLFNLSAV